MVNERFDILVTFSCSVAQVMTLVDNYQAIITGALHVDGFSHRHDIRFKVVFVYVFLPHILQVGRADD